MLGKKLSEKTAKNVFYIHRNIVTKKTKGTKRAKQFFQKHTNSAYKKCWEKNRRKKCEKRFFIFTQISLPKNGGEKARETIFPETQE